MNVAVFANALLRIDVLRIWITRLIFVCMSSQKELQERCGTYFEDVFITFAHIKVSSVQPCLAVKQSMFAKDDLDEPVACTTVQRAGNSLCDWFFVMQAIRVFVESKLRFGLDDFNSFVIQVSEQSTIPCTSQLGCLTRQKTFILLIPHYGDIQYTIRFQARTRWTNLKKRCHASTPILTPLASARWSFPTKLPAT